MRRKTIRRRGNAPPVLARAALLLALGVVATTPLVFTIAKYAVSPTMAASARVAKWAPEVEVSEAWNSGRTAFIIPESLGGTWLAITDGPIHNSHNRDVEWAFRPTNVDSEVAAKFKYTLSAPGDIGWLHFDFAGTSANATNIVGTYTGFREDIFAPHSSTALQSTPSNSREAFFVYFSYNNGRPYAPANCYSTATFSWTIEQID